MSKKPFVPRHFVVVHIYNIINRWYDPILSFKIFLILKQWRYVFRTPSFIPKVIQHGFQVQKQPSEVFLKKGVLKICSKFTGQPPFRRVVSIKLLCNFIKIALRHMCSPANLLHIFRTLFLKNTSGRLLLEVFCTFVSIKHSILYAIVLIVKM